MASVLGPLVEIRVQGRDRGVCDGVMGVSERTRERQEGSSGELCGQREPAREVE